MQQLTPKEEAIQLVEKFYIPFNLTIQNAKECAIICVDKILELVSSDDSILITELQYYQQLKQEISKL